MCAVDLMVTFRDRFRTELDERKSVDLHEVLADFKRRRFKVMFCSMP